MARYEEICAKVLKEITPNVKERDYIHNLAEGLRQRVKSAANYFGVQGEIRVEGSVAKDTWLSGEPDVDIFMHLPTTVPYEAFGTICLEIAKEATKGFEQIERFAEHPYLEAIIDDVRVNIVPCYRVKQGQWISATDRTPFHTNYMKSLLDARLQGEVRLLKKFMKGTGVYGAEIRVGGFSGYLCELLTLYHRSFTEVLKEFADLRDRRIIDYECYYEGRENEAEKIFKETLVVVDPIDKRRNVAAAVRNGKLNELIVAARRFLENPHIKFFYPEKIALYDPKMLTQAVKKRGSAIVFVKFGRVKKAPDVLWGQLYKLQRSLRNVLQQHNFHIILDGVWSNERDVNVLIFELEQRFLPSIKKHLGPPIEKREECKNFLRKHLGSPNTISGPHIEEGRWVVETKRKYTDVVNLLNVTLKNEKSIGPISQVFANMLETLVNEEVLKLYSANFEFAKFLIQYLEGRPRWLG